MMEALVLAAALLLAFGNGANDNFKGFATVWGSDTLSYRQALILATFATVAGSLASLLLAGELVQAFFGKGLVPDAVVRAPAFMLAVGGGAAFTILLATRLGFPVSTTHALVGGLAGAGFGQAGGAVDIAALAGAFLAPMLIAPPLAAALSAIAHRLGRTRTREKDCACLVAPDSDLLPAPGGTLAQRAALPVLVVASDVECARVDAPVRVSISRSLDRLHILSAMSICFARGVNDTPKLAALLLAAHLTGARVSVALIAALMAIGGLIFARRVAHTMSLRVTRLDHGEGLAANTITALMVLFASKLGLPVSTTHVAVGAIAGIGASARSLNRQALRNVLLSWVATLPLAAAAAYAIARVL